MSCPTVLANDRFIVTSEGGGSINVQVTAAVVSNNVRSAVIGYNPVESGVIPTGDSSLRCVRIPFSCTIQSWTILADQEGSVVIDVLKCAYEDYPSGLLSIVGSSPPTLSSQQRNENADLPGWDTGISSGDVIAMKVESASGIEIFTVELPVIKT